MHILFERRYFASEHLVWPGGRHSRLPMITAFQRRVMRVIAQRTRLDEAARNAWIAKPKFEHSFRKDTKPWDQTCIYSLVSVRICIAVSKLGGFEDTHHMIWIHLIISFRDRTWFFKFSKSLTGITQLPNTCPEENIQPIWAHMRP